MKAQETKASRLFTAGHQLTVPVWQRPYSWREPQWNELWQDIARLRAQKDSKLTHFLGSVVVRTEPWDGLPSHAQRFAVVDGQQRLATLTVLLIAIRDLLGEKDKPETRDDFTGQLFVNLDKAPGHQARLMLQEGDEPALRALVDGAMPPKSIITDCYRFFTKLLRPEGASDLISLVSLIQTRLDLVWISLEESDNAHRVFQTINAGGKPLRQTDLVRNFFFLLLASRGDEFHQQHWQKLEKLFDDKSLEQYFSAWAIAQGYSGSNDKLFVYFNEDLSKRPGVEEVWGYGEGLIREAENFSVILGRAADQNGAVERELQWLRNWRTKPAEGLLFLLFRLRDQGRLRHSDLEACLSMIFSFFARRFVAGFEPNLHRSILVQVAHRFRDNQTSKNDQLVLLLRVLLSKGSELKKWPSDDYVIEQAVRTPLYTTARSHWVVGILGRINEAIIGNKKLAPKPDDYRDYQVEHVMPQKLTADWQSDLHEWGVANAVEFSQKKLHVLGNLTLSVINPELSNHRLETKVRMIQNDSLRLNSKLKFVEQWTEGGVDARTRVMAKELVKVLDRPMTQEEIDKTPFASEGIADSSEIDSADTDMAEDFGN
jgi:hypothetical protein